MANEVVSQLRRDAAQPTAATPLSPVELVRGLSDAIRGMRPDDVVLEVSNTCDGDRVNQRLSLRCYRKGRLVTAVDEERNE
jgi:hypothetical protein